MIIEYSRQVLPLAMKLTTRGRYAITALLDLAVHSACNPLQSPTSLAAIGERNHISRLYLEKLFRILSAKGLVKGERGSMGGYRLARSAADISVGEVLQSVDHLDATSCKGHKNCRSGEACLSHDLWVQLNTHMVRFLQQISLEQLAQNIHKEVIAGTRPPLQTSAATDTAQLLWRES
ncbi:MAG: Rrf2 family transcriptional regulator [Gammaproteobacteria bacterium]